MPSEQSCADTQMNILLEQLNAASDERKSKSSECKYSKINKITKLALNLNPIEIDKMNVPVDREKTQMCPEVVFKCEAEIACNKPISDIKANEIISIVCLSKTDNCPTNAQACLEAPIGEIAVTETSPSSGKKARRFNDNSIYSPAADTK
jgi:hypothetical protein